MRKLALALLLSALSTGCSEDDGGTSGPPAPTTGSIVVTTTTTGDDPDDTYTVSLDGVLQDVIGPNATRTLTGVSPGSHTVTLGDVASQCTVDPAGASWAVSVIAGATTDVAFAVTCIAPPPPPPPPPPPLEGTYTLVSVQQGAGMPQCGPSLGCTGTLTLTATRYTLDLTTPDPDDPLGSPPITIVDTGTYTTDGNEWTQTSDGNLPQSVGTFTLQGSTLTVAATSAGVLVTSVWNRTG